MEIGVKDILDWADGVLGAIGTEHKNKVTEEELRIAVAVNSSNIRWDDALKQAEKYAESQLPKRYALVDAQDWSDYYRDHFEYLRKNYIIANKSNEKKRKAEEAEASPVVAEI